MAIHRIIHEYAIDNLYITCSLIIRCIATYRVRSYYKPHYKPYSFQVTPLTSRPLDSLLKGECVLIDVNLRFNNFVAIDRAIVGLRISLLEQLRLAIRASAMSSR